MFRILCELSYYLIFCQEQSSNIDDKLWWLLAELRSLGIMVAGRNSNSNLNDIEELQVLVDFIKHELYQKYKEAYSDKTLQQQIQKITHYITGSVNLHQLAELS